MNYNSFSRDPAGSGDVGQCSAEWESGIGIQGSWIGVRDSDHRFYVYIYYLYLIRINIATNSRGFTNPESLIFIPCPLSPAP